MTTGDHNKHRKPPGSKRAHFVGAGAGVGVVGGGVAGEGAAGAGADAGALAGTESRTEPPPRGFDDISASNSDVAMKIPADQDVRRDNSVAAPRAPNAV